MPSKTYKIFENREVKIPWNWAKNSISIAKNITWNEKSTTITSAKLRFSADPNSGYVKASVEHNYSEVGRFTWGIGDSTSKSDEFDVVGVLINGSNYFKAVVAKEFANLATIKFIVSITVVITYEGDEPEIKADWQKYLEYAAIGIGATAAVITVGGALKEEKK